MCTEPLIIRHPTYKNYRFCPKIQVPCGHCDECVQRKQNDIYVRLRTEYELCQKLGGTGVMADLTYSDDVVPKLFFDGKPHFVFNKLDVIQFIKRLRTRLDRASKKHFNRPFPDFKYFVSAEFGKSENGTHRPHYHLLFFFREPISLSLFRSEYVHSMYVTENKKLVPRFGYIYKMEEINPEKGGISYSAKYVAKDVAFDNQREYIKKVISKLQLRLDNIFGIVQNPDNDADFFKNRCIRQSKEYKKAVEKDILPFRRMLQFYMISNDLGGSAFLDKYFTTLFTQPVVNFDGFPYAIPRYITYLINRDYGFTKKLEFQKSVFMKSLARQLSDLVHDKVICGDEMQDLIVFAHHFIQPDSGRLSLVSDMSKSFCQGHWDEFLSELRFYQDNGFLELRQRLYDLINIHNSVYRLQFRASLARQKREKKLEKDRVSMLNRYGFVKH